MEIHNISLNAECLECLSCFIHMGIFGLRYRLGLLDNCLNKASSCGPVGERE